MKYDLEYFVHSISLTSVLGLALAVGFIGCGSMLLFVDYLFYLGRANSWGWVGRFSDGVDRFMGA